MVGGRGGGSALSPASCLFTPLRLASRNSFARASIRPGHPALRRAAVRRVVFEPPVLRRIVRRRDDDPVRQSPLPSAVVCQNRVRTTVSACTGPLPRWPPPPRWPPALPAPLRGRASKARACHAKDSGPSIPLLLPVLANRLVMARMCHSLNELSNAYPVSRRAEGDALRRRPRPAFLCSRR